MKLEGKVAIVTGSSRGLGKAIALGFAREGADVVIAARSEAEQDRLPGTIHKTAEEVRALGRRGLAIRCDVSSEESVEEMVQATLAELGRIDILVNNAAVGYYLPLMQIPARHWDLVFRVNVKGPFLCIKAVVPHMIKQKSGSIINISSTGAENVYSRVPAADGSRQISGIAYGASKAALERLTRGLAVELAEHEIAVNALKPGAPTFSEGLAFWQPQADSSRWRSPDQYMVKAAIFLATQDALGVTGQVFIDDELCRQFGLVVPV